MHDKMAFTYCYKSLKIMEYFLAFIVTGEITYYELVKARNREEAYEKVRKVVKNYTEIEISSAIE